MKGVVLHGGRQRDTDKTPKGWEQARVGYRRGKNSIQERCVLSAGFDIQKPLSLEPVTSSLSKGGQWYSPCRITVNAIIYLKHLAQMRNSWGIVVMMRKGKPASAYNSPKVTGGEFRDSTQCSHNVWYYVILTLHENKPDEEGKSRANTLSSNASERPQQKYWVFANHPGQVSLQEQDTQGGAVGFAFLKFTTCLPHPPPPLWQMHTRADTRHLQNPGSWWQV